MRAHGPGRGTRRYKGVQSGTTWATIPSGVTMDIHGINFGGGSQLRFNSGSAAWAGTTINVSHGFTTLTGFAITAVKDGSLSGVSEPTMPWVQDTGVSGGVSVSFRSVTNNAILGAGGNAKWVASGTD